MKAANPQAGEVALSIDGKDYILRMSMNRAAIAEGFLGKSIWSIDGGGVAYIRALFFSMVHDQGVESIDAAGDLLNSSFKYLADAVMRAFTLFFQMLGEKVVKVIPLRGITY